ncbi:MAG: hypothetical protein HON65_10905 [Rhodospirillales bacterium]|jgi:hypothetical protein|nr:hypothetical protein [Rhodospirillales bacterium]
MKNPETENTAPVEMKTTETEAIDERPSHIPEKFWNMETGSLRTDDLMKSYNELEKKFTVEPVNVPKSADDYDIKIDNDLFNADQEINERLHKAGFTNEQTQLVYDMAIEQLLPAAQQLSESLSQKAQAAQLEKQFGGKARWNETERQLRNWGRSNLSMEAFETMSKNYDGVMAMNRMMQKNEPPILSGGSSAPSALSERDLKSMMNDPRYWRDQNPAYIEQIRQGFEALYQD